MINITNHKEMEFIMINIPEILVANGAGAFLVLFLLLYRIRISQTNQFDEKAYNLCSLSPLSPRSMKRLVLSLMHAQVLSFIFYYISQIQFPQVPQASLDIVGVYL